jgi:hypothetical protein
MLTEVMFEGVEELEELVADPFAIASATDAGRHEDASFVETVERSARRRRCHPVRAGCDLCAHDGLLG